MIAPRSKGLSTATAAQQQRILDALRESPQTTDSLRELGIYQASARLFGLRKLGHNITTALYCGRSSADGLWHARMARYTLIEETGMAQADGELRKRPGRPAACPQAAASPPRMLIVERHKSFARWIVAGATAEDAYARAFGTAKNAKAKGEALQKRLAGYIDVTRQQHLHAWELLGRLAPSKEWRELRNAEEVEMREWFKARLLHTSLIREMRVCRA